MKINNERDIANLRSCNLEFLKEGIRQCELKVIDENNRKDKINNKVCFLLPFTTFCLYFLIKEIYLLPLDFTFKTQISNILAFTSISLIVVICMLIYLLLPKWSSSSLGASPSVWLIPYLIEDNTNLNYGKTLTGLILDYEYTIDTAERSTDAKNKILKIAMLILSLSVLPLTICVLLTLF